jgi:phosphatidylglycerophosphate synthase
VAQTLDAAATSTLRRRALLGYGAAGLAAAAAGVATGALLPLSAWFPIKAAAVVSALAALTAPALPTHGQPTLGPANALTLGRAALVGWLSAFVGEPAAEPAVLALLAASSAAFWLDWVDGKVARATGSASPFGALLDMELDGITVLALSALCWDLGRAGAWVLASGALRYLHLAATRVWPWMNRPLFPTERRRFVCGVQIVCLLGCLAPWPVPGLSAASGAVGLAALVYSFGADTVWLFAKRAEPW